MGAGPWARLHFGLLPTCARGFLEVVKESWKFFQARDDMAGHQGQATRVRKAWLEPLTREMSSKEKEDWGIANRHQQGDWRN